MKLYFSLEMKVSAPKKTTTLISLECLGVKVDRAAGSVQRALEEALTEFGHQLRAPLLREARAARSQPWPDEEPKALVPADMQGPEVPTGPLPEAFAVPKQTHRGETNFFGLVIPEVGGARITSIYGGDPEAPYPEELPKTDPA